MIECCKDETVMDCTIKIQFKGGSGYIEGAADDGGIFKDALSSFWETIYVPCAEERILSLPLLKSEHMTNI